MNENNKIKAEEWFEKAKHDLATVELIIKASGYSDTAAVLLQQATEKYLKGYLISRGWKLIKTHDLKLLLDEATKYDRQFEEFYDLMDRLTQYYVGEKYPPIMKSEVNLEEIRDNYEKVKELVSKIKEVTR